MSVICSFGDREYDDGVSVAVDPFPGNIYVTGRFRGSMAVGDTTLTSNGEWNLFVMKLDSSTGSPVWAERLEANR